MAVSEVVFFLLIIYAFALVVKLMRVMYVRYAVQQLLGRYKDQLEGTLLKPSSSKAWAFLLLFLNRKLPLTATWASGVFTCSCVLPTMLHIVLSVGQATDSDSVPA